MQHNSYFDGNVQSLGLDSPDGKATIGVITPGAYSFSTSTQERMCIVAGVLNVKLPGADWQAYGQGTEFLVPSGVSFDVEASADVAYICYYA